MGQTTRPYLVVRVTGLERRVVELEMMAEALLRRVAELEEQVLEQDVPVAASCSAAPR